MRKISIVKSVVDDYDEDIVIDNSDWVEVSDEDYDLLRDNIHILKDKKFRYSIVEQHSKRIPLIIDEIKNIIKKEADERKKMRAEYERKAAEAKEKRDRKKLEALKKKFGEI